jgi:hypothetical protein
MRIKLQDLQGAECVLHRQIGQLLAGKPLPLVGMVLAKLLAQAIAADCEPTRRVQVCDALFEYVSGTTAKLADGTPPQRH